MIAIKRGPEPDKLRQKKQQWQAAFENARAKDPKARPHGEQYGHPEIRAALRTMSNGKCFYCEQDIGEKERQVEHLLEVECDPAMAYEWENLYLSCKGCNDAKRTNAAKAIRKPRFLDPCGQVDPADHLTFDNEFIFPRNDSELGENTILKFDLNRDGLWYKRGKRLRELYKRLDQIRLQVTRENRKSINDKEWQALKLLAHASAPFSLLIRVNLEGIERE